MSAKASSNPRKGISPKPPGSKPPPPPAPPPKRSPCEKAEEQALRWFKGNEPYAVRLRDVLEPFFREATESTGDTELQAAARDVIERIEAWEAAVRTVIGRDAKHGMDLTQLRAALDAEALFSDEKKSFEGGVQRDPSKSVPILPWNLMVVCALLLLTAAVALNYWG